MNSPSENSLSSSLTDMMTSLMVIFVLLLVTYLQQEKGEAKAAQSQLDEIISTLTDEFSKDPLTNTIRLEKFDKYTLCVIVPENLLFDVGRSDLTRPAQDVLMSLTPKLLAIFARADLNEAINSIGIEGHTDRLPVLNDPNQLKLSQNRARAVTEFMFSNGSASAELNRFKELTTAGGRGPIECHGEDSKHSQPECRTVKFKIRVKTAEERDQPLTETRDLPASTS